MERERKAAAAKAKADRIAKAAKIAKAKAAAKAQAAKIAKAKAAAKARAAAASKAEARGLAMKRCAISGMFDFDFRRDCESLGKEGYCTNDKTKTAQLSAEYMHIVCDKTCNILACEKSVANKHK